MTATLTALRLIALICASYVLIRLWRGRRQGALRRPVPGLTTPLRQYYTIFAGLVDCPIALAVLFLTGHPI